MQNEQERRKRPEGMPTEAPKTRLNLLHGRQKPKDVLPEQKALTDEEEVDARPARWKVILVRVLTVVVVLVALALLYVFLLLGEPDEDADFLQQVQEEEIRMPMNAVESPGEGNLSALATTFGQPVLSLYGSALPMNRSRVYDTAFGGGYARRVTLTYAFEDGETLLVESIRPTAAVTLLGSSGYALDADSLYAIGGFDAARMENSQQIVVFGQTESAAYAVVCPKNHEEQLDDLLKQTALMTAEDQP